MERCRKIHAKFIERHPRSPSAWIAMIDLEIMAEENERARALCEMAINVDTLDMPELVIICLRIMVYISCGHRAVIFDFYVFMVDFF